MHVENKTIKEEVKNGIQPEKEDSFIVSGKVVNELLTKIAKLPWEVANPIIVLIKQNFISKE